MSLPSTSASTLCLHVRSASGGEYLEPNSETDDFDQAEGMGMLFALLEADASEPEGEVVVGAGCCSSLGRAPAEVLSLLNQDITPLRTRLTSDGKRNP